MLPDVVLIVGDCLVEMKPKAEQRKLRGSIISTVELKLLQVFGDMCTEINISAPVG